MTALLVRRRPGTPAVSASPCVCAGTLALSGTSTLAFAEAVRRRLRDHGGDIGGRPSRRRPRPDRPSRPAEAGRLRLLRRRRRRRQLRARHHRRPARVPDSRTVSTRPGSSPRTRRAISDSPAGVAGRCGPRGGSAGGSRRGADGGCRRRVRSSAFGRGSTGATVRQLQLAILATGLYLSGGADGTFGSSTHRGVTLVQRVNGLPETGVVDAATASVLGLTGSASSPSTPAPAGTVVQLGATGAAVQRVQQLLIKSGVNVVGGADGVFGPQTRRAVSCVPEAARAARDRAASTRRPTPPS